MFEKYFKETKSSVGKSFMSFENAPLVSVSFATALLGTRLSENINFDFVISMNNYDVNLCNTNRRLPNGGVAANER